ncbi:MAG: carboxypeptidase regulatory-like domain-containing protein [Candidatus Hydrogenedentota bacterium]
MADSDDLTLYTEWRHAKDRQAFEELVSRHAPMVYGVCRRMLISPSDAEEAALETFQILAHSPTGPRTHLATWLHAAAATRGLQRARSRQHQSSSDTTKAAPTNEITWETLQRAIDSALLAVPWEMRIPIIGQYVEDKTQPEIADEVGLDRQRVISNSVTGIELLRKELANRGMALDASRLKELLATHMVEPVPSSLAPKLAERAIADPLMGRRLATGFELDETIKKTSATGWMLPLVAVAIVAAVIFWVARGRDADAPDAPPATAPVETAETTSPPSPDDRDSRIPGPDGASTEVPGTETMHASPTAPDRPAPEQTVSYQGTVRDAAGNPITQAKVFAGTLPTEPAQAEAEFLTGPLGAFELNEIPADTRQVSAWHEAYKPVTVEVSSQTASPIEITLTPAARVSGIVTYIGSPVPEQTVELVDSTGNTLRTQTGEDGTFLFTDADPGTVELRAHLEAMEPVNRRRTMYSAAVLEAGLTTDVDFTFGALDAAIEGSVTFNQEVARGAKIIAGVQTPSGGEELFDVAVQSDGTFLIEALPAGPTILQLQGLRAGRTEHLRSASLQTRSGQTTPYDFVLSGNSTVIVQVSGVVPGATGIVGVIEPGTSLLDFDGVDSKLVPTNLLARIPLTQDGEYTLEGLEGRACTICAYAEPPPLSPRESPETEESPPPPLYDAAGITLQPGAETVIVLQLR